MDIHTQQEWNPHSVAQIVVEIMQACKKGTCSVTTATPFRGASTEGSTHSWMATSKGV